MASETKTGVSLIVRRPGDEPIIFDNVRALLAVPYFYPDQSDELSSDCVVHGFTPRDLAEHGAWLIRVGAAMARGEDLNKVPPPYVAARQFDSKNLLVADKGPIKGYQELPAISKQTLGMLRRK